MKARGGVFTPGRCISRGRPGSEPGRPGFASGFDDVGGLESFRTLDDLEVDLLAFVERLEAVAGDRLEVHENVFTAGLGDEAEPLFGVEPLHGTCGHNVNPPFKDSS